MTITPKFPEFGIEFRYINKIVNELSVIYARLINQYKFKYHTLFLASFYKIDEEDVHSDVHRFNDLNNLSVNIYELNFYQDGDKWKHNLIPIEISKNKSDKVIDLLIYKNHYALIKKLHVFLGDHNKSFVCRWCLSSYTCENALTNHKENCGEDNICTIRTSNEPHLYWKNHFHKNPLYFRIIADFEADNEIDGSNIGNKTTNIYKQNPVPNGYYIISELEDVLESGYYESPLGYDNLDWFVKEVIKLENKMAFYFKNTKKDIIMTQEDEEKNKNINICRFCEKILNLIKFEIIVI